MKRLFFIAISAFAFTLVSCEKEETSVESITVPTTTIDENPEMDQSVVQIEANYVDVDAGGIVSMTFVNDQIGGLRIDNESSGQFIIKVDDPSIFDFESVNYTSSGFQYEVQSTVENDGEITDTDVASFTLFLNDIDETVDDPIKSVQQRLEEDESPFDIYTSDNSLLDSLYGKTYAGGLIFYLNISQGGGLVASSEDLSSNLPWDTTSFANLQATNQTSQSVGNGSSNTSGIVISLGVADYAASACQELDKEGFNDWFLPTSGTLDLMYTNLHANGVGSFGSDKYWSSSEFSATSAWTRDFSVASGQTSTTETKVNLHKVRPVRAF